MAAINITKKDVTVECDGDAQSFTQRADTSTYSADVGTVLVGGFSGTKSYPDGDVQKFTVGTVEPLFDALDQFSAVKRRFYLDVTTSETDDTYEYDYLLDGSSEYTNTNDVSQEGLAQDTVVTDLGTASEIQDKMQGTWAVRSECTTDNAGAQYEFNYAIQYKILIEDPNIRSVTKV